MDVYSIETQMNLKRPQSGGDEKKSRRQKKKGASFYLLINERQSTCLKFQKVGTAAYLRNSHF